MNKYPIWKSFTVISLVLLGIIFSIPSIIYNDDSDNWFLNNKINLGLDLQGGSYLLLEVQLDVLYQEELENFSDSIRLIARDNSAKINQIIVNENDIIVSFEDKNKINEIKNSFFQMYRSVSTQLEDNKLIIKIIIRYMTARRTLQDNTLLLQTITFHTKKERSLKLGKAYAELLAQYVEWDRTFLWEKWFEKLQSREIQLYEAFCSILIELWRAYKYVASINKDVADMIDITYRYF